MKKTLEIKKPKKVKTTMYSRVGGKCLVEYRTEVKRYVKSKI